MMPEIEEWVAEFQRAKGRPLKILHIGNIANNAFKNSLALRSCGIECDVLCNDYYHAMGCPEWECADFVLDGVDLSIPNWEEYDLDGYRRPDWFVQGFYGTCLDYLIARNQGKATNDLWDKLQGERATAGRIIQHAGNSPQLDKFSAQVIAQRMAAAYTVFGLEGRLDANELFGIYQSLFFDKGRLDKLFSFYDVVIGYAMGGLYSLISDTVPYIAYEHGTIRQAPFDGTLAGQLCGLVFRAANNVLITNCDNIIAARRLQLPEYRFVPHAILEYWRDEVREAASLRKTLSENGKFDFLIFHPTRQHWSKANNPNWEKGNDILIRGFAQFAKNERPGARLIMVEWGETLLESKRLIEELGLSSHVKWVAPMPVRRVVLHIAAVDALADQFLIGAWGALMPIGLMLGKPTLNYVNEDVHRWCFPEMPPVLNCRTEEGVFRMLQNAGDPAQAEVIGKASRDWYDKYHSMEVVAERLCEAAKSAIEKSQIDESKNYGLEFPVHWLAQQLMAQQKQIGDLQSRLQSFENGSGSTLNLVATKGVGWGRGAKATLKKMRTQKR